MDTIKLEAKRNLAKATDLDNFRSRYVERDIIHGVSVFYPSSEIYSFEHNYFVLLSKADYVEFKPAWEMRPDYTSFDMYGNVIYWPLLLFINDVYSIEDYRDLEGVYIPSYRSVLQITRDRIPRGRVEELHIARDIPGINVFDRTLLDPAEIREITTRERTRPEEDIIPIPVKKLEERVDTYILDQFDIADKTVRLTRLPINASSIHLYIDNMNVPQKYGYHYVLIPDEEGHYNTISWKKEDSFNQNGGMEMLLEEEMELRIKYLYEEDALEFPDIDQASYNSILGSQYGGLSSEDIN